MFSEPTTRNRSIVFVVLLLVLTIGFETLQQLYYIRRYDLFQGVAFLDVLQSQSYRWLIWLIVGISLIFYIRKNKKHGYSNISQSLRLGLFISLLVAINILAISIIQMVTNGDDITLGLFFKEYVLFYIYQKAPIFTLGYIAISVILHLYFTKEQLEIEVEQLNELKETHQKLYEELKAQLGERTSVLSIKIGNKRRVVPVADIVWIEADDYCAKIHLISGKSYTMRSTLKNLEEKLQRPFMRVHRKAIVNMSMIKELSTYKSPSLVLMNNVEVAVSKRNLKAIKNYIA